MNIPITIEGKVIVLTSEDLDETVDIDNLLKIDHSNLYGEAVTISALYNKFGLMKADAEHNLSVAKLNLKIYEANLRKSFRNEAFLSKGVVFIEGAEMKLTEKVLDDLVLSDNIYSKKANNLIKLQREVDVLDSTFWALQSKSKKLEMILKPLTPKELCDELIEKRINTFLIRKNFNH